jgi:hypothetical protein
MKATITDVNTVLNALETFIKQRPRLEYANYGAPAPYRAEVRSIAKDKKRALEALAAVRRSTTQDPELLADSFRAFSGRLEWNENTLHYTTGQYFPTEYRKAAASVLETYLNALAQKWVTEHPQAFKYKTIADVKAANQAIGNHWFSRDTMRFFNTRIESKLLTRGSGRQFFITSERQDETKARKYTIREAMPDGNIDTFGEFQAHSSLEDAQIAVREIA